MGGFCIFKDVDLRIKKRNKILFSRSSECLQDLRKLICEQKHTTLVLWIFECLQIPMNELMLKYPNKIAIKNAFDLCISWAQGKEKMTKAKRAILDCHAVTKDLESEYDIALCHAIGQGCSTVHVETHALGLVFYELTAIVLKNGYKNYQLEVLAKIDFYIKKLKWYQDNIRTLESQQSWADFLIKQGKPNKEKLLAEKSHKSMDKSVNVGNNSHMLSNERHDPVNKQERLLTLYNNIYMESLDGDFFYEKWKDDIIEDTLYVSKYTVQRYINILLQTDRVFIEYETDWNQLLRNRVFSSLEEITHYIKHIEIEWTVNGSLTAEKKRLLHIIRLIGWMDLFYQFGKIAESDINRIYTNKSEKRKIQRDFAILKGLRSIPMNVKRRCLTSHESGLKQWFYVIEENERHRAEMVV